MDKLSESDMNEYRDAFTLFDTKFEGVIPAIEVGNLCRALGINPKQSDVKKLTGLDSDPNKKIKFDEFVPIFLDLQKMKDDHKVPDYVEAFKSLCDNENCGKADMAVFKNMLVKLGEKLEPDFVEMAMKGFEPDEDGKIKYIDFIKKVMEEAKN
ncbi:myosin-2 essential light chain-like [Symsagittifera roscoffensis]|uniref:myosin-2 essential light chain-like n=1 Tax=Symsagittifera roscoffensis TaxID=84072 RepID=UPI00307CC2E4